MGYLQDFDGRRMGFAQVISRTIIIVELFQCLLKQDKRVPQRLYTIPLGIRGSLVQQTRPDSLFVV